MVTFGDVTFVTPLNFGLYEMSKITKVLSLISFLSLAGCSNMEQTEEDRMRKQNAMGEYIQRNHDEYQFSVEAPKQRQRALYPWEEPAEAPPPPKTATKPTRAKK